MNRRLKTTTLSVLAAVMALAMSAAPAQAKRHKKRLLVSFKEGTPRAEREKAAKDLGLTVSDDLEDIEVSFMEAAGDVGPQEADRARKHAQVFQVEEDVVRNWLLETPTAISATPFPSMEAVWQTLGKPKQPKPATPAAPTAPASGGTTGAGEVPWGVARVDAPAAWASGQGAGVKVAVVDTGVDCTHPDLKCDFGAGYNVIDPTATPMDDNEHGTHCSGTIAGRQDGKGVVGVAPQATIIPVKVLDKDGSGSLSDIVKGINWAAKNGADVISMSLGGASGSAALQRAVNAALAKGVVVIAAAGNSGPDPDTVGFPAGYPGVIAIAASDSKDAVAKFSSRGAAVAFIAPGVDILSTVPGGGYAKFSGTSMACPHMAGLAALAIERGAKGPAGVRAAFARAATKLPGLAPTEQGAGLVDAAKLR